MLEPDLDLEDMRIWKGMNAPLYPKLHCYKEGKPLFKPFLMSFLLLIETVLMNLSKIIQMVCEHYFPLLQ